MLKAYLKEIKSEEYFDRKREEAAALTKELADKVDTSTASKEFDEYCRYNFMDNLLRGGYPIKLGKKKIFYVYSRKHGDLERDYNFFTMLPEYYSQGNGNFRDVNQNRRCDTFFAPFVGRENIRKFYSLIQLDGYNPLSIEKLTYCLPEEIAKKLLNDKEQELFFEEGLTTYLSQIKINDRRKRYVETKDGLRQYLALNKDSFRHTSEKLVRTQGQQGDILKMSLLEKLVMMCAVKFAALDAYGMGVEMEGGKPGWYDALNGLPGMFGSSMNETYELCRMLDYTVTVLKKYNDTIPVLNEVSALLNELDSVNQEEWKALHRCDSFETPEQICTDGQILDFWNKVNDWKEEYRNRVFEGVSGEKTQMSLKTLIRILSGFNRAEKI